MQLRESNIDKLAGGEVHDALIVGGGINGAVSAAALAGKGVKTALIDQGDFAGMTSMWSSNLIWGGIKYMESYDFKLVRELCVSRNHLIKHYPSTVQEIRFLTTITKGFRWHPLVLWAGTWLYWFFGNCFTKIPRLPRLRQVEKEEPVINTKPAIGCFEYSDAFLHDNDARFVFNFVRKAMNSGCVAANYVESTGATRENSVWTVHLRDMMSGREFTAKTRVLINACGPLADRYNELANKQTEHSHVLSKGVHLIVDQLTPHKRVLAFFDEDGRLFFSIPMGNRTCIGTTDTRTDDPHAAITDEDIDFVLKNINARLNLDKPLDRDDIIATRCGVRPLAVQADAGADRDFLQLSRKHEIDSDIESGHISIFGGKLTDCVNVGNEITDLVEQMGIQVRYPKYRWYGEPVDAVRDEFFHQAQLMSLDDYTDPASSELLSTRLWRRYAAQAIGILENIREDPRQAEILIEGTEYIRAEVRQAARREMITKLEDFLRRRSKISLVSRQETIKNSDGLLEACEILFGDDAKMRFDEYFREHPVVNGIAEDPSSGQAAADDATRAQPKAQSKKEGEFETLNW
ncbi:glycerol-3-phosphate dehydrogenase/oxidase [Salinisphaera sp.]|uniref:glycerol-3-phosphate dehydrogenase/oxidase n=1 Tax=Salinisphaera sp. TaxID=1914330 RepID=UPI002D778861|nr:glycerol-3-phosphate dehydrogenase/oxidase [Salinisphaera sp.]HET7315317.1 glycerol-3-phosphate dehydrogenase/oxidase [Salinisphaera sp.]